MTTISGIVNSVAKTLNTYTAAISVTSTNIANSETSGYTRQEAVIETDNGSVDITKIKRIYSSYLTSRLCSETEELGKWEAEQGTLSSVEEIFSDTDDYGLSSAMSEFWNSWSDVVNDPSDSSARSVLASTADTLADTFNSMSSDLSSIQKDTDDSVVETVNSINDLVEQIAAVNKNITAAEASGTNTNTYKDTLDSLVLELSSLVDINTYTNEKGQTCIQLADGKPLVDGTTTWSLSTEANSATGLQDVTWVDNGGDSSVITDDITGGKLGGYLEIRDDVIPIYQAKLDELAAAIMEQVNTLHTSGYDINGESGVTFFTGTSAVDMAVNPDILDDPGKIAAAATADGAPDDGSNASAIADLQNSLVLNSETSTFSDYYSALVSGIGELVNSTDTSYSAQSDVVEYCRNQRDSVSAVSSDEEMAKLLLYQNAYSAAAEVMTILDEMMQTLIDMVD
jgi:flagellar hook-associated protein 1 FlgK